MGKKAFGEATFWASSAEILNAIRKILFLLDFTITDEFYFEHTNRAQVTATHGMSPHSWGEELKIEIDQYADGLSSVKCTSKAALETQLFDAGKNKKNVATILYELSKSFKTDSPLEVTQNRL